MPPMLTFEMLDGLFDELNPILRSITGPGLERSLAILSRHMPLEVETVPSGTQVFDWEVPPEWHLTRAQLIAPDGRTIADTARNNLHIVHYSEPVDRMVLREELESHLHSLPDLPDAVPYVTSYYQRNWGFSIPHRVRERLSPGQYRVLIESRFLSGGVPFGQCVLPGESGQEIVITSYLCHPSLANNELSGPLVLAALYRAIGGWTRRRFTYRFVLHPETIGSLCYLHRYGEHLRAHMTAGLVLTCLGGPEQSLSYELSRTGNSLLDRTVLAGAGANGIRIREFDPTHGSDERQYCSPGFNLPVGQMARTIYGQYAGYHNSLDTKDFMGIDRLVDSAGRIERLLQTVEIAGYFHNLSPYGEPQLGKRGLYPNVNGASTWNDSSDCKMDGRTFLNRLLTVLNYSDGQHAMIDIAAKSGCPVEEYRPVIEKLEAAGLLALDRDGAGT